MTYCSTADFIVCNRVDELPRPLSWPLIKLPNTPVRATVWSNRDPFAHQPYFHHFFMYSETARVPPSISGHWARKPARAINKYDVSFFSIALSGASLLTFLARVSAKFRGLRKKVRFAITFDHSSAWINSNCLVFPCSEHPRKRFPLWMLTHFSDLNLLTHLLS